MFKKIYKKLGKRRLLVAVLLLVFAINFIIFYNTFSEKTSSSIWDGSIASKFSSGNGTYNNPYVINNGSELAYFFALINGEESQEYYSKYYILNNNIDLDNIPFNFAKIDKSFNGYFDGNGYMISNLLIDSYYLSEDGKDAFYTLFDSQDGSTIKNINFNNVTIKVSKDKTENIDDTINEADYVENDNIATTNEENNVSEDKVENPLETPSEEIDKEENNTEEKIEENNSEENNSEENNSEENNSEENTDTNASDNTNEHSEELPESLEENNTEKTTEEIPEENVETNEKDEIIVLPDIENIYVSLIANNAELSTVQNINVNEIEINSDINTNIISSLFILNDVDNNKINNININGKSNLNDTAILIKNYNNAEINNILYLENSLDLITNYDEKNESIFSYTIKNDKLTFDKNYPVNSIIELLNQTSQFDWAYSNNTFRIKNNGVEAKRPSLKMMAFRSAPTAHDTGIDGNVVYLNDYEADKNYYGGLNYTSSSGQTPTTEDKNIYSDANLAYVEIHYHGSDYDENYVGNVSLNEQYSEIVYYKVFPVNSGAVSFDLIDHPFGDRPNNRAFLSWTTPYEGASISLNMDTYVRSVSIPVTYSGAYPNNIVVDFYAVWGPASSVNAGTTSWNNIFANTTLKNSGMQSIVTSYIEYLEDMSIFYLLRNIAKNNYYPANALDVNGNPLTGTCDARGNNTCPCYVPNTNSNYQAGTTYYELVNNRMTVHTPVPTTTYTYEAPIGSSSAGYFRAVTIPRYTSLNGYYDANGNSQTGSCNSTGGCSSYELINFYDNNGNMEVITTGEEYYYLVTRDTNIVVINASRTSITTDDWSSSTQTKPVTITSINNNTNYGNGAWYIRSNEVICNKDTRIEYVKVYTNVSGQNNDTVPNGNGRFNGNYYNTKIGRGLVWYGGSTSYTSFANAGGGGSGATGSSSSLTNYTFIVESGLYNNLAVTYAGTGGTGSMYIHGYATYGSDIDRAIENNDDLEVRYCASGSWQGNIYGSSVLDTPLSTTVKSGKFGSNKADYAAGIYVGGRQGGSNRAARVGYIEGGWIYNLIGGPLSQSGNKAYNDTYMYIKGGSIDVVIGGAGRSETYGNRIIQITGGQVNYAVCGGSNGVKGGNGEGTLDGDTYVYVGGNAIVGDETLVNNNEIEDTSDIEAGSVFGIGNGREGYTSIGTVNNSYVVIDGNATVRKNVYGGGNYGAAGQSGTNITYKTEINIHDGATIGGSVYGGGNNNGSGSNSNTDNITINMDGGIVNGSIYGGSRTLGTIYGSTNVNIKAGTIGTDVYGGGEGGYANSTNSGTFVKNNVSIVIGTETGGPNISGSVYGGSAFGTVNATDRNAAKNNNTVDVTINNGTIGNVFGGAKGSSTYTPYVKGNITVTVNDGTITNVYGGMDAAGKPQNADFVYLNGGEITNAFGGGNQTDQDSTNIYLRGADVETLYGGSNQRGVVPTTNVYIESGEVDTVYGGNNVGGTCTTTNVKVTGATINDAVFGGGNAVDTTTTNVNIYNIENTVPAVFGGGNAAGVTTTNVSLRKVSDEEDNNISITNLYGGSNSSGVVTHSNIRVDIGELENIYGGNNEGTSTEDTEVLFNDGTVGNIYGGGNNAPAETTIVKIKDGTITNVYGGGKGTTATVSGNTFVEIKGSEISGTVYGGGDAGSIGGDTRVDIYDGDLNDVFGGGNLAVVEGNTNVNITGGDSSTIYGGGNLAEVDGNTNIKVLAGTIDEAIYGGGNQGNINGETNIIIANMDDTLPALYGGGNAAGASNSNILLDEIENVDPIEPYDPNVGGGGDEPDEPDEPSGPTYIDEDYWIKVESTNDLDPNETYMILNQNNEYALTYNGSSFNRGSVAVTQKGIDSGRNYYEITGNGATTSHQWIFTGDGTIGTMYNKGDNTKYVRLTNTASQAITTQANSQNNIAVNASGNYWQIRRSSGFRYYYITYGTNFSVGTSGSNLNIYKSVTIRTVIEPETPSGNRRTYWVKATSTSDITNTDEYMLLNQNNDYSLSYSGNQFAKGSVAVTEKGIDSGRTYYEISGNGAGTNYEWKFTTNTTGGKLFNNGDQTKYLYLSTANSPNYLTTSNNGSTITLRNSNNYWTISRTSGYGGSTYYLIYNNNAFSVAVNNTTNNNIDIYKKVMIEVPDEPDGPDEPDPDDPETPTGHNIVITNIYGGSNQSGNISTSNITMNLGEVTNMYGGNNEGGSTTTTNITVNNGSVELMFGGGNQAASTDTNITINDGEFDTIYGGGNQAQISNDTNVIINDATVSGTIYGGGNAGTVFGSTNVEITSLDGDIQNIFGGGNAAGATTTNITLKKDATAESNNISVENIFGGSNQSGTVSNSYINIETGNIDAVYGGNNAGGSTSTTHIEISDGEIDTLYGGGNQANSSATNVTISDGTIGTVYAGGNAAGVNGNTDLTMTGGTVTGNLFGGGNQGIVSGNTNVVINDAHVNGSAYAGGNGASAVVNGSTSIAVGGSSTIGTDACTLASTCSVFGGGNAANTGSEFANNSEANVDISGGTIYGNVYGGANTAKVYGSSDVDIGADVTLDEDATRGDIHIYGTVFGGGEANASGSDTYDWTFIGVTNSINVNINGLDYDNLDIDGSIFGSGNASTTTGTSQITIKNYGTYETPKKNISIQRTNLLVIDNSSIALEGATDRTNDYSNVLFTLSIIDELDLKNNSTLYLEKGANLLKEFKSLTSTGALAVVNVGDNGVVTKNVDNRIYMLGGEHLNVAKNSNVTDYGEVSGMTFFGMYKYNGDGTVNQGIYDKHDSGDTLNWADVFNDGAYVLGLHKSSHDITADGFYTNYMDENTMSNVIKYIEPTPEDSSYYMWVIGESVIEYEIDLTASKYSTLGTYELSLTDFTDPNTTFEILDFDYSGLAAGITLTDRNNIPRIAEDEVTADSVIGLSMETSNSGWLVNGLTSFMNNPYNSVVGTKKYIGGNNTAVPTVLFYLYHAKNIATNGSMGTVSIQLTAVTQIDDLTKKSERLIITVNLTRQLFATANYEGTMTAGRKYSMFTSTATNITSKSSFSAYFALFSSAGTVYRPGYHRTLISTYVLPLNTKITMIDLSGGTPTYYYRIIDSDDVDDATRQLAVQGDIMYDLSMFEVMGAQESGIYYDDVQKNIDYYHPTENYCDEEFIFIVDLADTNITSDQLGKSLQFEMLDEFGETQISVLGMQHENLKYNIYANKDATLDASGTIDTNKIYSGQNAVIDLNIDYTQSKSGSTTIYDTQYFDSKAGIKISIYNSDGELMSGSSLLGLYYVIDDVSYYPNIDGTARIKVADKVDSMEKWIRVCTGTSSLPSDTYSIRIETFGSPDGIYCGLNTSDAVEFNIELVNEIYGLDIYTSPESMIINSETGLNAANSNRLTYMITYNSGLSNPSIHLKLYRRDYEHINDTTYSEVDLADYVSDALTPFGSPDNNEYVIVGNPNSARTVYFTMGENLISGTYKLEFILYDGNSPIGTVDKYIIIK